MRISDWSSDVCSSDLQRRQALRIIDGEEGGEAGGAAPQPGLQRDLAAEAGGLAHGERQRLFRPAHVAHGEVSPGQGSRRRRNGRRSDPNIDVGGAPPLLERALGELVHALIRSEAISVGKEGDRTSRSLWLRLI